MKKIFQYNVAFRKKEKKKKLLVMKPEEEEEVKPEKSSKKKKKEKIQHDEVSSTTARVTFDLAAHMKNYKPRPYLVVKSGQNWMDIQVCKLPLIPCSNVTCLFLFVVVVLSSDKYTPQRPYLLYS